MESSVANGIHVTQIMRLLRWHNHLDPLVRKSPWSETEEFVFVEAHKLYGNKWADISKLIPGRFDLSINIYRTDNAIKNHFYSTLRKLISRIQKDEIQIEISNPHHLINKFRV